MLDEGQKSQIVYIWENQFISYDHPIPIFIIIPSLRWLSSHHPGITITTTNQGDFQGSGDCMNPKICSAVCQLLLLAVSRAPNARTSSVQASKHRGLWIKPWEIGDLTWFNDEKCWFYEIQSWHIVDKCELTIRNQDLAINNGGELTVKWDRIYILSPYS